MQSKQNRPKRNRRTLACEDCRLKKVKCEYGDGTRCVRCITLNKSCSGRNDPPDAGKSETLRLVEELKQKVHQMESILTRIGPKQNDTQTTIVDPSSSGLNENSPSWQDATVHDEIKQVSFGFLENFPPGQSSDLVFLNHALNTRNSTHRSDTLTPFTRIFEPVIFRAIDPKPSPKPLTFPEPDLLQDLVDLYFQHNNSHFRLLHRPSFEEDIANGMHFEDRSFGEVVLLVAAVGSQQSKDPRVLLGNSGGNWLSRGWKWFSQVQILSNTFFKTPSLYELQKYCLASMFCSSGSSHITWSLTGIGLRLAQGKGIHYLRKQGRHWTIEAELWKRAFWVLLGIDRFSCSLYGRPCLTHEEQFEVELPVLADEEYWDNADQEHAFKQPDGKPSKQASFIASIQLSEILAFTLRTVYATGKFKAFLAKSNPQWREEIVQKIDSALNKWHDSLPEYLRWPVHPIGSEFYYQSAGLCMIYHSTQIQVHWPFIPSLIGPSSLSLSSLVICANAARSCSHMFEVFGTSTAPILQPCYAPKAIICSMVLLLYIWEGKKFGLTVDSAKELENVQHCLNYLALLKPRFVMEMEWSSVQLLERLLAQEMSNLGVPPLPHINPAATSSTTHQPTLPLDFKSTSASNSQLSDGFEDMFGAFIGDSLAGDKYLSDWSFDDLDGTYGLGSTDGLYGSILTAFNAAVPPHLSPVLETSSSQ